MTTGWTEEGTTTFKDDTILEVDLEREIIDLEFVVSCLGFGLGVCVATACDCEKFWMIC